MRDVPSGERPERGRFRARGSGGRWQGASRRPFVGIAVISVALGLAGCLGRESDRGTTTSKLGDEQVTTTAGERVEVLLARVAIREGANGPRVSYRLRNAGAEDATVALRAVLRVAGGGTYERTNYVDVPAGDEVVVGYRVATWEELGEADEGRVRRHEAELDTYVNGERRRAGV